MKENRQQKKTVKHIVIRYLEELEMALIKNLVKSFKKADRKGTRYEASMVEQVWDKTAIVATYRNPIL